MEVNLGTAYKNLREVHISRNKNKILLIYDDYEELYSAKVITRKEMQVLKEPICVGCDLQPKTICHIVTCDPFERGGHTYGKFTLTRTIIK